MTPRRRFAPDAHEATSTPAEPPQQRRDPGLIRLGVVEYLNMQPLVAGLEGSAQGEGFELWHAPPARLVAWMERGLIDAGMLPVAAALEHPDWEIVGDSMIGARGAVQSVLAMGPPPAASWERIVPDAHSRTSNLLAQVILRARHGAAARATATHATGAAGWALPEAPVPGQGHVLIGTHAFELRHAWDRFGAETLDLGAEWLAWTGLPFVFAAWTVRGELRDRAWLEALEAQRRINAGRIEAIVAAWPQLAREGLTPDEAVHYLTQSIHYDLDADARAGLARFAAELERLR